MISKTCSYAIRAALYLASQPADKFVPIREISEKLGISFHFLTKILQVLTARNILLSFRGPNGGITLARPKSAISLAEIVLAIDGPAIFEECVLGLEKCDDNNPCPVHDHWKEQREECREFFDTTTLEKLIAETEARGLRLSNILVTDNPSKS
ncbi:MAG: Rrf2 family transcriptional regulator [Candidatus Latescibacteria bacterium]|nr:Rrf2 family transcriptional regulator [Candidatus Latescibacterota bacterium]NIM21397.1 Rrf2 family transcriptional regulator [Candidatus Latescibacterota bacterium]NIM65578.1 Rrf2 family transcriptional regulator [Candidatus Latescibacterota bacterium]NIO01958.1 Rrf2 family transcriptional regulator [Candidatus Latescibacterota bacterium]NIO28771.1 Rrf2 family transcriptional regulator [Candidatus Latescibacterota bacterium]